MPTKDPRVDAFFRHVPRWCDELHKLREILLETELTESYKWGQPCYTYAGKNVILLAGFASSFALSFLKGALLTDRAEVLVFPGPNSRSAKLIRFTEMSQIAPLEQTIRAYVAEVIELEQLGAVIPKTTNAELALPDELVAAFARIAGLEDAFRALTLGRQRGYVMHVTSAKQTATRIARIEKCIPKIIAGKGFQD